MVYLHLPSSFTDEEVMLQNKYEKLKKKKKALQSLKAPRQEPERSTPVKRPQVEGRDAREIARKLIKSGAISAIKKAPKREEMSGFKRPTGSERGRRIERNSISGYQPFSGNNDQEPTKPKLYENPGKTADEHDVSGGKRDSSNEKIGGNTIFVQGGDISEQILREIFSDYGSIININMETEKNRGFVTFEEPDSAAAAISGANDLGPHVHSVSYARRQPLYNNTSDSNKNSKMWSSAASRKNGKGNSGNKEQHERTIICYDNPFD